MEHDNRTYFKEHEQDDVKGFTVLETSEEEGYHIAEKWLKDDGENVWMDYWVPEAQLNRRVSDGACEPVGQLSDEQFDQVCGFVNFEEFSPAAVEAQA